MFHDVHTFNDETIHRVAAQRQSLEKWSSNLRQHNYTTQNDQMTHVSAVS